MMPAGTSSGEDTATLWPSSLVYPALTCTRARQCQCSFILGLTNSVLCGTQRGRDGDLAEERPSGLLLEEVEHRLGRVDGRAAPDGDDNVRARVLELLHPRLDVGDGRVLADLEERRGVGRTLFEDVLDGLDDFSLPKGTLRSGQCH